MKQQKLLYRIRFVLILFAIGLILSGIIFFPLKQQLDLLVRLCGPGTWVETVFSPMAYWIDRMHEATIDVHRDHAFVFYCTDWVAFAMIIVGLAFWGPIRNPVRNRWVIEWGILISVLSVLTVLISAPLRGWPWFWLPFDSSFGILALVPLWLAHHWTCRLEKSLQE
ncbi:MAG: hypothetical protein JXA82_07850 [Sedimentisphaerales bacterium]|nr:hypothetical protein [Sedimentisphaerales bacterium]